MPYDREFLSGTISVLILGLLSERPMYGYEMLRVAERRSARAFELKEGSLYPALHKMQREGLLTSEWSNPESGRQRKYYELTAKGRRRSQSKRAQWEDITAALRLILSGA
jgi:PadR family transcriptional regulator, regulatory protein PadR